MSKIVLYERGGGVGGEYVLYVYVGVLHAHGVQCLAVTQRVDLGGLC